MIPGSNLLNMAFRVIAQQTVSYYRATGRTVNSQGIYVTQYAESEPVGGSFQPVPTNLYQIYGLDLTRVYYTLYTAQNILSVNRDVSGDQIVFNGQRFQCEANNDWFALDGWKGVLCVLIGDEPSSPSPVLRHTNHMNNSLAA
jgi:hypothetical protein